MPTVGQLVVELRAETAALKKGLDEVRREVKSTHKTMTDLGEGARRMGRDLLAAFGVGSVIATATKVFRDFTAAVAAGEEEDGKLNAVLRATGMAAGLTSRELRAMADELARGVRASDEEIKAAETELLTFRNIQGDTFKEGIRLALDMSVAMGQDLRSTVLQVGKALNDPILGLTALRRVGVSFTQQQQDMITAMVKAGDTAGAQKIILQELGQEFGGTAAGANTGLAGALANAKKEWDNFLEAVGRTPQSDSLVTETIQGWADILRSVTPETDPLKIALGDLDKAQARAQDIQRKLDSGAKAGYRQTLLKEQQDAVAEMLKAARAVEVIQTKNAEAEQRAAAAAAKAAKAQADQAHQDRATAAAEDHRKAVERLRQALQSEVDGLHDQAGAFYAGERAMRVARARADDLKDGIQDLTQAELDQLDGALLAVDSLKLYTDAVKGAGEAVAQMNALQGVKRFGQDFMLLVQGIGHVKSETVKLGEVTHHQADLWHEAWVQAAHNSQDAMADFFVTATSDGLASLRAFAKNVALTIQRMLANLAAAKIINAVLPSLAGGGAIPKAPKTPGLPDLHPVQMSTGLLQGYTPAAAAPMALAAPAAAAPVVHVHQNLTFAVSSIDSKSGAEFIRSQAGTIAEAVADATRRSTAFLHAVRRGA